MNLNNKVAIVTGGSQGVGKAYCKALLKHGMKVMVCDIKEQIGNEFVDTVSKEYKGKICFQRCDVTSLDDMKKAFDVTLSTFGRIDVVVNNAGFCSEHEWRRILDVNVVGVIHGVQLAFQYMGKDKGGNGGFVVNTASIAGLTAHPLGPVYIASKHAVVGLTLSYGTEYHYKRTGVKVSAVCPGGIDTDFFRNYASCCLDKELGQKFIDMEIEKTPKKPEEIAEALMTVLKDGRNGALYRIDEDGLRYEMGKIVMQDV